MIGRIVSAALLLPLFVKLFFLSDPRWYLWLVVVILVAAFLEYRSMMKAKRLEIPVLLAGFWLTWWLLNSLPDNALPGFANAVRLDAVGVLPALLICLAAWEIQHYRESLSLESLWAGLFGVTYLAGLGHYILKLEVLPQGGWWTFLLFFYSWVYDGGAYFVGKTMGKHGLSPISPKKTLEGLVGGLLAAGLLGWFLLPRLVPADFPLKAPALCLAGVAAGLLAQAGDLCESLLKRFAGVKDSGWFFRFGGLLDKVDSPLFVAPFLFWLATLK
jgi:phosphatidate cytidylyltransferase